MFKRLKNAVKRTAGIVVDPLNVTGHGGIHGLSRGDSYLNVGRMLGTDPASINYQQTLANQLRNPTLYPDPGLVDPNAWARISQPQWGQAPPSGSTSPPQFPSQSLQQQYRWNQLPSQTPYQPAQLTPMRVPRG